MPLISSSIDSLKEAVMPVSAKISEPNLGSAIPSKNFCFLELLVAGRLVIRKFLRVSETLFWETSLMFSRASSAVWKGWKAASLTILEKRSRLGIAFWIALS